MVFTAAGTIYTLVYARKIKRDPLKSVSYESDAAYRQQMQESNVTQERFRVPNKTEKQSKQQQV